MTTTYKFSPLQGVDRDQVDEPLRVAEVEQVVAGKGVGHVLRLFLALGQVVHQVGVVVQLYPVSYGCSMFHFLLRKLLATRYRFQIDVLFLMFCFFSFFKELVIT